MLNYSLFGDEALDRSSLLPYYHYPITVDEAKYFCQSSSVCIVECCVKTGPSSSNISLSAYEWEYPVPVSPSAVSLGLRKELT